MNVNMLPGIPLIREAERESHDGSGDERGGEREEEEHGGRGEVEDGWPEEPHREEVYAEAEEEEDEEEEEEEEEVVEGQGDGWEQRLIRQEAGEGWGEGTAREAEQEVEEEDEEEEEEEEEREPRGEGLGRKRRYTNEGWEERYVGDEGEEPLEITPAPLQTPDDMGASENSFDLATQEEVEPVATETTEDDTQHLYAKVPETHKAKKRLKMMKQAQKEERKARKQKMKMEAKEEKVRRKAREKERKDQERQRKKGLVRLQEDMGMRLQDIDPSTATGRAQAQFIDAATAPFF